MIIKTQQVWTVDDIHKQTYTKHAFYFYFISSQNICEAHLLHFQVLNYLLYDSYILLNLWQLPYRVEKSLKVNHKAKTFIFPQGMQKSIYTHIHGLRNVLMDILLEYSY